MNEAYQRLRDDLPEMRAPDADSFPVDAKRVKAWVEALPRANQQATVKKLRDALESLQKCRLDGASRLAALELMRPSILDAIGLLDKRLLGSTFPLPPTKAKVADQIHEFQRMLSLGYRIAVVELCGPSGNVPLFKGGQVTLALARAVHHGARELALDYYLYRTPRSGAWKSLNALHRFARALKLDEKPIEDPAERAALGVRQIYAQALLLALSNPYRFSQREQVELWPVTRELAEHVELQSRRPQSDGFAVTQTEDRGPGYLPDERESAEADLLWLGLSPLRQAFEGPLGGDNSGDVHVRFRPGRTVVASAELLRRLRAGWGHASERSHQRLGAGHALDTVIGLSGLHFHLAGSQDFDSFMRQVLGVGAHGSERNRAAWVPGSSDPTRIAVASARVLDQSLGGYRLAWDPGESIRARVGELLGISIHEAADLRTWMVGTIRWLRYDADGGVDAGIELLARRAHAVGLRGIDRHGMPKDPQRGILIESLRGDGNGVLHFVAPPLFDANLPRMEVARAADRSDFEQVEPIVSQCGAIQVLENAGDYLLLCVKPVESE